MDGQRLVLRAEDYAEPARQRLSGAVWDFLDGGSGAELSLHANRSVFERMQLRPRVLVDVSSPTTATTLLGAGLAAPVGVAPVAYQRLIHPDGELATAEGAGAAGALFVVSFFASQSLEDIAEVATGPLWLQMYWLRDRAAVADLAGRAEAAGYRALVLTVDAPRIGRRLRDLRNGFAVDPAVRAVNLDQALTAAVHHSQVGHSGLADYAVQTFDASITWPDLAWLRGLTDLPIVLKGLLTAEDARLALEYGVDAVIVSNHGGRQLDGGVPSLSALPEVVDEIAGRCPVLLDGGVRSGRDVFIALARGASAVLVGRPPMWGLAVDGAAGVARVLNLIAEDLADFLALTGRPSLADIDASAIRGGA